jgi:membrane protein DedA with SNARE-associated domain
MEDILIRFGLLAVFIGAALEGDVTLILAGVVAHLGLFDLMSAIAVGAGAGVLADVVCYGIGRARAGTIRDTGVYQRVGPLIERLAKRVGAPEIMLARFIYGARIASMLFWGMRGLPVARFVGLDVIGCALWSSVLTSLGYAFSGSAAMLIGRVKRAERWLLVSLLLAAAAMITIRWWARRMRRRTPQAAVGS